ncbi:MAG: CoA transferase [Rhodoferax sp.]|nr:CoA transferase [Rhodoferax sp.]
MILDLGRVLSGPYCTMMLCDLGATVIKVEQPQERRRGKGISCRCPAMASLRISLPSTAARSRLRSISKADPDRAVFEQLLARADVLVENFRPGVMDKLGYPFALLQRRWPALVLASISGFGQTGPYRSRAAYDVVVQAMSGMMSITGHPDAPPTRCGASMGDLSAAMFACNGIQAALLQRTRTGAGCHVDVSMFESQIALLEGAIPRPSAPACRPSPGCAASWYGTLRRLRRR